MLTGYCQGEPGPGLVRGKDSSLLTCDFSLCFTEVVRRRVSQITATFFTRFKNERLSACHLCLRFIVSFACAILLCSEASTISLTRVQRRNSCLELEVLSFDEVESVTQLDDAQLLALEILRTKATLINPKYTPARSGKNACLLLPTCTVQAN